MAREIVNDPFKVDVVYTFSFPNGESRSFAVNTDLRSQELQHYVETPPEWARLNFHQCPNCPLNPKEVAHCPAAISLADIIEYFSDVISYNTCDCRVSFPTKEVIVRDRPIQDALYALIGLRLATSLCPEMRFFAPLSRFHDPFASVFSTIFRTTSYFALSKHLLRDNNDQSTAIDFSELQEFYEHINQVNSFLAKRLEEAEIQDATPNSIFALSLFGISMTMLFDDYATVLQQLCELGLMPHKESD